MEVWMLREGDIVIPPCHPGKVRVTDTPGLSEALDGFERVPWEGPDGEGCTYLPGTLDVLLVGTDNHDHRPWIVAAPFTNAKG